MSIGLLVTNAAIEYRIMDIKLLIAASDFRRSLHPKRIRNIHVLMNQLLLDNKTRNKENVHDRYKGEDCHIRTSCETLDVNPP